MLARRTSALMRRQPSVNSSNPASWKRPRGFRRRRRQRQRKLLSPKSQRFLRFLCPGLARFVPASAPDFVSTMVCTLSALWCPWRAAATARLARSRLIRMPTASLPTAAWRIDLVGVSYYIFGTFRRSACPYNGKAFVIVQRHNRRV